MKFKLESIKKPSLDWDVEKNGVKEMDYDNWKYNHDKNFKDSFDLLFDDDYDYNSRKVEVSLNSLEGVDDDDFLWTKTDLGKYTIDTATIDKQNAEEEFEEIGYTEIDKESNAAIDEMIKEMENEW